MAPPEQHAVIRRDGGALYVVDIPKFTQKQTVEAKQSAKDDRQTAATQQTTTEA
jgi:hypothetical protein